MLVVECKQQDIICSTLLVLITSDDLLAQELGELLLVKLKSETRTPGQKTHTNYTVMLYIESLVSQLYSIKNLWETDIHTVQATPHAGAQIPRWCKDTSEACISFSQAGFRQCGSCITGGSLQGVSFYERTCCTLMWSGPGQEVNICYASMIYFLIRMLQDAANFVLAQWRNLFTAKCIMANIPSRGSFFAVWFW